MAKRLVHTLSVDLPSEPFEHAAAVQEVGRAIDALKEKLPSGVGVVHETKLISPKIQTGPRKPRTPKVVPVPEERSDLEDPVDGQE